MKRNWTRWSVPEEEQAAAVPDQNVQNEPNQAAAAEAQPVAEPQVPNQLNIVQNEPNPEVTQAPKPLEGNDNGPPAIGERVGRSHY